MMRATPLGALAATLVLALGAATASAQTAVAVVLEFGLLATWAADCRQPPGKVNIHSTYLVKAGEVLNVHDAGPAFHQATYVLRAAKPAGIDLLLTQAVGADGKVANITLRRIGDKIQIWRVVAPDNTVPVNNGKFTGNDASIPALSKCG